MKEKKEIKDLSLKEVEVLLISLGQEPFRARQLYRWLFKMGASTFQEMTNLPLELRALLEERYTIGSIRLLDERASGDGTRKLLFGLDDGLRVETVLIPSDCHITLCLSTQVGCPLGCAFCLTGFIGFKRKLAPSEITDQVLQVQRLLPEGERITNLVLMGMGEPLLNYDNVIRAIHILTDPDGFGFSPRRITLSTAGITPRLKELAEEAPVNIAISLNAPTDQVRSSIMPVNRKYPLGTLLEACRSLPVPKRKRISFEYVLLDGVNDSEQDAVTLAKILRGIRCKINLIPFNPAPGLKYRRPEDAKVKRFQDILRSKGYNAAIRESRGTDIRAACGGLTGEMETPARIASSREAP